MNLDDIINDLRCGELSAHGMFATDKLTPNNAEKLRLAINSGLLALYTKFPLLTKEIVLEEISGITLYELKSEHAQSSGKQGIKYLLDTPEDPFTDIVLRIEAVFDGDGNEYILNNTSWCHVALTPTMLSLEIPNPEDGKLLSVIYRARHPEILNNTDVIMLPEHMRPALLSFIAYRIYSGMASQDGMSMSQSCHQKYAMLCNEFIVEGLANKDDGEFGRQFDRGGWI